MKTVKKILGIGLISISALSLSGCEGLLPLPDEQRYQNVDELWEELEISSIGTVLSDTYGGGDGTFGQSTRNAEIQGVDSLSLLEAKLLSIEDIDCNTGSSPAQCYLPGGIVSIDFSENDELDPPVVSIRISDSSNGKENN